MTTLEFHDPSGAIEVKQPFAPRVSGLAGKRVGFVSNEQWQAFRMLPLLKSLLRAASTRSSSATLPEGPAPLHAAGRPLGSKRREFRPSP